MNYCIKLKYFIFYLFPIDLNESDLAEQNNDQIKEEISVGSERAGGHDNSSQMREKNHNVFK